MRNPLTSAVVSALLVAVPVCKADTLEMKDGSAIQGKYVGGTAEKLSIETAQGVLSVSVADVLALKFAPASAPVAVAPPAAAPVPVAAGPVSVPAGSVLTVRMDTQVSSKTPAGTKFTGKLVGDLAAGNVVVAKAGTTVVGQVGQSKQAGRLAGKSQLQLTLVSVDLSGTLAPILTTSFAETGKSSFRKTARNAGVGALVGNAVDNDGGAGKGAAVGVGVSLIREGDSVTVPPGAILEFRLSQPLTVTVGQ